MKMLWEKEQVNELKKNPLEQPQDSHSSLARVQVKPPYFIGQCDAYYSNFNCI